MGDLIPNLWPDTFKLDVQTPYSILSVQAHLLSKVTRGLLEGKVETETNKETAQDRLVVVAPAYNGYRHTLITAVHNSDMAYPAEVRAKSLGREEKIEGMFTVGPFKPSRTVYPVANNDEQMINLVESTLKSEETAAVILSLIAKSNEAIGSPHSAPE